MDKSCFNINQSQNQKFNKRPENSYYKKKKYECRHRIKNGRWTEEEHKKFINAILLFGNDWKEVESYIITRNSTQARSHAQKFLIKLKRKLEIRAEEEGFTLDEIDNIESKAMQICFQEIIDQSNLNIEISKKKQRKNI